MVRIVTGNILEADDRNIIIQQVNCQGAMNSGIAKQIRDRYPDVFTVYKEMCDAHKDNTSELLGKVCYCLTPEFMIINCFGQNHYGRGRRFTDYDALRKCFETVACNKAERIGIPYKVGCGLGGGNWSIVYKMICDIFKDMDVKIYKLEEES